MGQIKDISGLRFGNLVAIRIAKMQPHAGAMWLCRCDCGRSSIILSSNLRNGQVSCGCRRGPYKHGLRYHSLYKTWLRLRDRCNNPNNKNFKDYGGRGITVCARWDDFSNFLADVGERPTGFTLDRINNSQGYSPGNVRWATWTEQANNRRPRRKRAK